MALELPQEFALQGHTGAFVSNSGKSHTAQMSESRCSLTSRATHEGVPLLYAVDSDTPLIFEDENLKYVAELHDLGNGKVWCLKARKVRSGQKDHVLKGGDDTGSFIGYELEENLRVRDKCEAMESFKLVKV
ncbi:uncharacterized protein SPPG_04217 [Spizellomyces punctatus DAOM BR117]|uniref:Uncharacterized protein n=1 Tax=Spizellomyces punctatus (strain DAOM BR117) TaxID=645134 RepID=A0A0L0HI72_SPIPD|nr:uncharacterized protein SPPG_04217 [Spizellomyces punctatus DAOM BR117]KND01126.1 hypothetical protein SPPG_04217 [Spizellomyces punctatus DAOM BR117]|eukprot:XP_016609165.1 hypothetical protein SPPG_04217 [Spizellomyces punctatus DAOM BR117]